MRCAFQYRLSSVETEQNEKAFSIAQASQAFLTGSS